MKFASNRKRAMNDFMNVAKMCIFDETTIFSLAKISLFSLWTSIRIETSPFSENFIFRLFYLPHNPFDGEKNGRANSQTFSVIQQRCFTFQQLFMLIIFHLNYRKNKLWLNFMKKKRD